jgi:hypothetical protein
VERVLVEFLGLPGAGKSTIAGRVSQILRRRGIPVNSCASVLEDPQAKVRRRMLKSCYIVHGLFSCPRYAARSATTILGTRQGSIADLLKILFNWLFVSSLMRRHAASRGVCLLEEGVFQALWSIGIGARSECMSDMAKLLFALTPLPTAVVVIGSSRATVERRLRARAERWSRMERWMDQDPTLLDRAQTVLQHTQTTMRAISGRYRKINILNIGNDSGDPDQHANTVAEFVVRLFCETAVPPPSSALVPAHTRSKSSSSG